MVVALWGRGWVLMELMQYLLDIFSAACYVHDSV
jgi:hypothetical protein